MAVNYVLPYPNDFTLIVRILNGTQICYPFETIWYAIKHLFIKVDPIEKEQLAQQSQAKQKKIDILTSRLTIQRQQLDSLKNEKAYLLTLTQNDEKKYQALLASAQEELIAQQAIFSGEVTETEEGVFKKGDVIAKIISGKSPCSTGTHLHFEVRDNKLAVNPAEYLSQVPLRWGIGSLQETSFSGSWPWPVTVPAVITQEFGMSWFARPGGYSLQGSYGGKPHTGLDMVSEVGDLQVFAPSAGTLYSGKISCGGGKLSYVHLKVSSKISIYFLHVNTQ